MIKKVFITLLLFILPLIFWCDTLNKELVVVPYTIDLKKLNEAIKIIHISDYHSINLDEENKKIIDKTKQANPDFIALTGDILDSPDYLSTATFINDLTSIAQVFYINGNHENDYLNYQLFLKALNPSVKVLNNDSHVVFVNQTPINFIGISDDLTRSSFVKNVQKDKKNKDLHTKIIENNIKDKHVNVLLVHKPHLFDAYHHYDLDLILSGHTHGGQIRVPFLEIGLIAPDQGFFPKYDYGQFTRNESHLIISSGVGVNKYFVPRLFNPREMISINLL